MNRSICSALIAVASVGCAPHGAANTNGGDGGPACAPYFGDPSAPAQIELTALKDYKDEVPLADGDDLSILFPPQGGRVIFVGIRAKNVDGCELELSGDLRDTQNNRSSVDTRIVDLQGDGGGFGASGVIADGGSAVIANYANITVCPNEWASTDLFDQTFTLEVSIQDRRGKTASKSIRVVPRCVASGPPTCACICAHGYVLGQSCLADASVDATTD
jgi:hypothetical protein